MNSRIDQLFINLKKNKQFAVIPFIPINWPGTDDTISIAEKALSAGADAIELGIPFSDPLADGVTNQLAYQEALKNGSKVDNLFKIVDKLRTRNIKKPLIAFSYFNPIYRYGIEKFMINAEVSGLDAIIIVDLPPEESIDFSQLAKKHKIHQIFLLAPNSNEKRIESVIKLASGFLYCVSVAGTTGVRDNFSTDLETFVNKIKTKTDIPIVIGFGISKKEHIKFIKKIADGAVVGSAFVETIRNSNNENQRDLKISEFIHNLVEVD